MPGAASGLRSAWNKAGRGVMGSLAAKGKQVKELMAVHMVSVEKEETK